MRTRLAIAVLTIAGAAGIQPAVSQAKVTVLGSDLSAPANRAEAHGADSMFWSIALSGGHGTRIPEYGQITKVRIKGMALANGARGAPAPLTGGNFAALRPNRDGSVTVRQRSQPVSLPSGGDSNQINTFIPENLCVRPGEHVGFTDYGGFVPGFYPNGVPFQIFSRLGGSSTRFYTKDGGTKDGARFTGDLHSGEELLMQMVLATGRNVGPLCPRGPRGRFRGVRIPRQLSPAFPSRGYARVRTTCPRSSGLCAGTMKLRASRGGPVLGSTRFAIGPGHTRNVRLPLTQAGRGILRGHRRFRGLVSVAVRDRYGQKKGSRRHVRFRVLGR